MSPWAEAALFAAARAELAERVIGPALAAAPGRGVRPLPRLVARVPGARARPRRRARARAESRCHRRAAATPHVRRPRRPARWPSAGRRRRTGSSAKARCSTRAVDEAYRSLAEHVSAAHHPAGRQPGRPTRSRRRSLDAFETFPEQAEAKRLLRAALAEGPAHAYLFHGPPGVGKRAAALALRRRADRRAPGASQRRAHPGPLRARAGRRPDPDRRDPRAAARPAHAPLRGRRSACTSCSPPTR